MKKYIATIIVMLGLYEIVFAQNPDSAAKPVKSGEEWRMPVDAVKHTQDFADRLKKELGLDEATTQKIFQATISNTKPVDEIRMGTGTDKEKQTRLKQNQLAFKETLKSILSPGQYAAYLKSAAATKP